MAMVMAVRLVQRYFFFFRSFVLSFSLLFLLNKSIHSIINYYYLRKTNMCFLIIYYYYYY